MNRNSFGDAVAASYEQHMVPMVFEPYAEDLVARLSARPMGDVLELAAGTGIVTRKLAAARVNAPTSIVATDVSQAMLDLARKICSDPRVSFRQADATSLPFADASFDVVVCQFGVMFFPDRPQAYREARRVLRPGGRLLFSVWDRIEANDFAHEVNAAMARLFPGNPPSFMARIPHGHFDTQVIADELRQAGFDEPPAIETVTKLSRATSARIPAEALVRGTPWRGEIEERDPSMLDAVVDAAESALEKRFGRGPIEGRIQAFVISVTRA